MFVVLDLAHGAKCEYIVRMPPSFTLKRAPSPGVNTLAGDTRATIYTVDPHVVAQMPPLPPIPGFDEQLPSTGPLAQLVAKVNGDGGRPARPGEFLVDTEDTRLQRKVLRLVSDGRTFDEIVKIMNRDGNRVSRARCKALLQRAGGNFREVLSDPSVVDAIMSSLVEDTLRATAIVRRIVTAPPPNTDPKQINMHRQTQIAGTREIRKTMEKVADFMGLTDVRYKKSSSMDLHVIDAESPEQYEAMRRLLGNKAPAGAFGGVVLQAEDYEPAQEQEQDKP